jgi:hypothetical protein
LLIFWWLLTWPYEIISLLSWACLLWESYVAKLNMCICLCMVIYLCYMLLHGNVCSALIILGNHIIHRNILLILLHPSGVSSFDIDGIAKGACWKEFVPVFMGLAWWCSPDAFQGRCVCPGQIPILFMRRVNTWMTSSCPERSMQLELRKTLYLVSYIFVLFLLRVPCCFKQLPEVYSSLILQVFFPWSMWIQEHLWRACAK